MNVGDPSLSSPGRFNHRLESLRGVAAMMVAVGHAFLAIDAPYRAGWFQIFNGHAAVRLFFVLSGYVLGLALARMNMLLKLRSSMANSE